MTHLAPCNISPAEMTARDIAAHPAFGEAVALYLTPPKRECLTSWSLLNAYLMVDGAKAGSRERVRVLYLDKQNMLISDECEGSGTVDHAPFYPREVIRRALELGASHLIVTHNHPSGNPNPSAQDISVTKQLIDAAALFSIKVHDHVVTGAGAVFSMRANGLI